MRKLEVGSGNHPQDGYEHLDIDPNLPHLEYVCNMSNIPVEDNIFDEVLSIHVIEHQPWRETEKVLTEWVRVTKPGGMIRVATPNLKWICKTYLEARSGKPKEYQQDAGIMTKPQIQFLKNKNTQLDAAYWANFKIFSSGGTFDQHFACYDAEMLTDLLLKAGASRTEVEYDGNSLIVKGWK